MLGWYRIEAFIGVIRLAAAVVLVVAVGAQADGPRPGAGSHPGPASNDTEAVTRSHGWAVVEVSDPTVKAVLLHLPPRATANADGADIGTVRPAAYLTEQPERLAAWGNEVALVFAPETIRGGERVRRVAQTTAVRAAVGGLWVSQPEGRLRPLPALPGEGKLLGFTGSTDGPAALIADDGEISLHILRGRGWVRVEPPPAVAGPYGVDPESIRLVSLPTGIGMLRLPADGEAEAWTFELAEETETEDRRKSFNWRRRGLPGAGAGGRVHPPEADNEVIAFGDEFVYTARADDGSTELWLLSSAGAVRLARVEGVPRASALVPLYDTGRIALLWSEPLEPQTPREPVGGLRGRGEGRPEPPPRRVHQIAEVSVATGRVLFQGPARADSPVTARDFQLLAMLLVGVMLVIVLFVLRPDAEGAPFALPRGLALAEPGRRMAAALIDLAPALLLAIDLTGAKPGDLFSLSGLLGEGRGVWTLAAALAVGFVHTTLAEWLFGRSLGKALTGCEVVAVRTAREEEGGEVVVEAGRLTLWQAALRNFIRWGVPPLAMEGLSNPAHRHRGDLLAGTAVVVRVEEARDGDDPA